MSDLRTQHGLNKLGMLITKMKVREIHQKKQQLFFSQQNNKGEAGCISLQSNGSQSRKGPCPISALVNDPSNVIVGLELEQQVSVD